MGTPATRAKEECSIPHHGLTRMTLVAIVYVAGVILGLVCGDAHPPARIALAVMWPLGLLAFVITLCVLVAASLIAFPLFGAAFVAAVVVWWVLLT